MLGACLCTYGYSREADRNFEQMLLVFVISLPVQSQEAEPKRVGLFKICFFIASSLLSVNSNLLVHVYFQASHLIFPAWEIKKTKTLLHQTKPSINCVVVSQHEGTVHRGFSARVKLNL